MLQHNIYNIFNGDADLVGGRSGLMEREVREMIRLVSYAPGLSTAWVRSACAVWLFLMPGTALAQFEVKQPFVHQGEAELAYHGAYFEGTKESVVHGHEVEVLLGVTERFGIGLAGVLEQERGEDGKNNALKLTEIEAQAKLELIELKGDNGIGLALYSLYGTTTVGGSSENEFLFGPIVKAQRGKLSGTANFFAVSVNNIFEDGAKEPDHWNYEINWQAKYQLAKRFAFGIEGFSAFADIGNDLQEDAPDQHRLGPVLYVNLGGKDHDDHAVGMKDGNHADEAADHHGPEVAMAFGVLFGTHQDTADVALKWDVEIEF